MPEILRKKGLFDPEASSTGGSGTGGGDLGPGCVALFATRFEAPTYAEGVLDGQDMWSGADELTIATSKPHSGLHGVRFDATTDSYAVSGTTSP